MSRASAATKTPKVEQEIVALIAAAKLRLRFDRAVQRLVSRVKSDLEEVVPEGQALLFTVTAPIRVPKQTAVAIVTLAPKVIATGEWAGNVHGNQVSLRRLSGVPPRTPRIVGFVHNPESAADEILNIARSRMLRRA